MPAIRQAETIAQCVVTPDDLAERISARYRLAPGEALRIAFHAGPGDAVGSFEHWRAGRHDPRVPIMAYSTQFYTLTDRIGAKAHVITEPPNLPENPLPGFQFTPIARDRSKRGLGWHLEQSRYASRFLGHLRQIRPHVVVMGTDFPAWTYAALPRESALILTMHNTFWPMGRRDTGAKARLKQTLAGYGLRKMASAVCTSPECARQLAALTGKHDGLFVEMPQMPVANLPPMRARDRAQNLLFLGRIEADKGVFDLLGVFSALAAHAPELTLNFAGSGSAAPALQAAIAATPHAERIHSLGHVSAEGVVSALQRSDLLICPTRSAFNEGLALVVIEAAALGVPSVASSVVPARELVPEACAVFPADDTGALRSTLLGLIDDPAAYRTLAAGTAPARAQVLDRARSWGSQLARALVWPER